MRIFYKQTKNTCAHIHTNKQINIHNTHTHIQHITNFNTLETTETALVDDNLFNFCFPKMINNRNISWGPGDGWLFSQVWTPCIRATSPDIKKDQQIRYNNQKYHFQNWLKSSVELPRHKSMYCKVLPFLMCCLL